MTRKTREKPDRMKKKPQRSCRTTKDKGDLLRVVCLADGSIVYDPTGKAPGRGSYLCKNEECIKTELKKAGRLSKGLRRAISDEEAKALAQEMLAAAAKAEA